MVRSLAPRSSAKATAQQPRAALESLEDLLGAEHAQARGGQLDGERDAVQPRADLADDLQ
jgi:hypothetical protein